MAGLDNLSKVKNDFQALSRGARNYDPTVLRAKKVAVLHRAEALARSGSSTAEQRQISREASSFASRIRRDLY